VLAAVCHANRRNWYSAENGLEETLKSRCAKMDQDTVYPQMSVFY